MLALGTVETAEVENTIICTEVVIKNKPEKNVKPKCIDCNKRQISKDSLRYRKQKCNKCWYKYTNEKYSPKNNEPEEEESEPEEEEVETIEEVVETIAEVEVETIEEVVETIEEVIEEVIKTIEEEAKPVEEVKPVVSCDITEFLQRIETHLKKIDDFNTNITSQLIDCDILDIVKSIDKRLQKIEELQAVPNENFFDDKDIDPVYRYTVWTHKQYFTNRVIDEIKRRKHPIFKGIDEEEEESETTTIEENQRDEEIFENEIIRDEEVISVIDDIIKTIEETQEVEEVKTTIEEIQEVEEVKTTIEEIQHVEEAAIKIKHKIIPDSEWLEYIPDNDAAAKYILEYLDYIKDNIKIYKKNIELCNVRFVYVADSIQIRILTSDDITANYPMLIKRGYLEDCFRIEMDDCMAYKADFLKGIKYKNFCRKGGIHYKITDEKHGHPFFRLEKEILEYARLTNCEAIDTQKPNFKPRLINSHKEPEPINDAKSQMEQMKKLRKGFGKKWTLF
jgi:hypothetical protein